MNVLLRLNRSCVLLATLLIASCGGGSGGGGSGGGSPQAGGTGGGGAPAVPDNSGVTLVNTVTVGRPNLTSINENLPATRFKGITLDGTITGDVASLANRNLTVIVEAPDPIFGRTALLSLGINATSANYSLNLGLNALGRAGHYVGNVRVLVCLDAECRQQLAGTPLVIPYDVTIQEALTLDRSEVTVTVPFGTVPPQESIRVDYSSFSDGWMARATTAYNPNAYQGTVEVLPHLLAPVNTGRQLNLVFNPAPPGTYLETFSISSASRAPGQDYFNIEKPLSVRYVVTPNPALDVVLLPTRLNISQKAQSLITYYPHRIVTNTGVTATFSGIEYLTAGGTQGPVSSWWSESPLQALVTCTAYVDGRTDCLSPGLYTAQLRYRLTTPTGPRDLLYPISLTVLP